MLLLYKFYYSLHFADGLVNEGKDIDKYILDLIIHINYNSNGGINYFKLKNVSLHELYCINNKLNDIGKKIQNNIKKR